MTVVVIETPSKMIVVEEFVHAGEMGDEIQSVCEVGRKLVKGIRPDLVYIDSSSMGQLMVLFDFHFIFSFSNDHKTNI